MIIKYNNNNNNSNNNKNTVPVFPERGVVGVLEDESVVAPGGVRVVNYLQAKDTLKELGTVPQCTLNTYIYLYIYINI